jgi:hypothetical protein
LKIVVLKDFSSGEGKSYGYFHFRTPRSQKSFQKATVSPFCTRHEAIIKKFVERDMISLHQNELTPDLS